jgi:GNAT superfamily N-acetyltransferase
MRSCATLWESVSEESIYIEKREIKNECIEKGESMDINFHPLCSSHEPALTALIKACPDTGFITTGVRYNPDAFTVYSRLNKELGGVVASVSGEDDLVGAGFFRLERVNFEGQKRLAAYIFTLVVHPKWRREGIGRRLVSNLMEAARERVGADGMLYAHIQSSNTGSLRIFERLFDCLVGRIDVGGPSTRRHPTESLSNVIIRPVREEDLLPVAVSLNQFYSDHDFFPPETENSLKDFLEEEHHYYYVATDVRGKVMAGMGILDHSPLQQTLIIDMPSSLKMLNRIIGLVPRDGVLRRLIVNRVWFQPECLYAAQHLWETLRWELRQKGNMLSVSYDQTDGRLKRIFSLPFWLPMIHTTVAISYPKDSASLIRKEALTQKRPMYSSR